MIQMEPLHARTSRRVTRRKRRAAPPPTTISTPFGLMFVFGTPVDCCSWKASIRAYTLVIGPETIHSVVLLLVSHVLEYAGQIVWIEGEAAVAVLPVKRVL